MLRSKLLSFAIVSLIGISGCNSNSADTPPTAGTPQHPELFSSSSGALKIAGDAMVIRTNGRGMSLGTVSGTVGGSGQASVFKGPLYTVRDSNGVNSREELYDGAVRIRTAGDEYKYARFYITENDSGASVGVFGLPAFQPLPTSGSAKYTGTGLISEVGRNFTLPTDQVAISQVDVNFATGKVNASLDVPETAQSLLTNVDKLVARGLQIDGSRFSGTAVRAFKDGVRVNPTGSNSSTGAAGRFYGADGSEVGGVMHISGDDGIITGIFIAD